MFSMKFYYFAKIIKLPSLSKSLFGIGFLRLIGLHLTVEAGKIKTIERLNPPSPRVNVPSCALFVRLELFSESQK